MPDHVRPVSKFALDRTKGRSDILGTPLSLQPHHGRGIIEMRLSTFRGFQNRCARSRLYPSAWTELIATPAGARPSLQTRTTPGGFVLHNVKLGPSLPPSDSYRPKFIEPLLAAAVSRESLTNAMTWIIQSFGFETFLYVMTSAPHMDVESQIYFWTNQPQEWIELYDQRSYVEIDPRAALSEGQVTPFVWDTTTIPKTPDYIRFL